MYVCTSILLCTVCIMYNVYVNVDINTIGSYYITYNVSDNIGNTAIEVVREVKVIDTLTLYILIKQFINFKIMQNLKAKQLP